MRGLAPADYLISKFGQSRTPVPTKTRLSMVGYSLRTDDDPTVLTYPDGSENNLDWSVMLNVWGADIR